MPVYVVSDGLDRFGRPWLRRNAHLSPAARLPGVSSGVKHSRDESDTDHMVDRTVRRLVLRYDSEHKHKPLARVRFHRFGDVHKLTV